MNCPDCAKLDDGRRCDRGVADCPDQRRSALEAGIPASVIDGKKRLRDMIGFWRECEVCGADDGRKCSCPHCWTVCVDERA